MLALQRMWLLGAIGAGALVVGCQSNNHDPTMHHQATTQAVQCDKCQVTWVEQPVEGGKGRVMGYTSKKQMECPECRSAVTNFFETGNLEHTCKQCGGNMTICESH